MKYLIYFIIIAAFIDTFSQLPIMSPFAKTFDSSPAFVGLIVGMYSFSNMIGNILAGYWIDKNGAKKVLVSGLSLTGTILVLYAFAETPLHLITVRFFHGLFGGFLVPAAFTVIADRGKSDKQGKKMAVSGAAVGCSAIIGPAFGAVVASNYSINWVFLIIAATMISSAVLAFVFLPSGNLKKVKEESSHSEKMLSLLKNPMLAASYLGAFSLMFAQGALAYLLPLQVEALQFDSMYSGILLSTFGITAILIFLLPINKIFDTFKHHNSMLSGMLIIGIALILLSSAYSLAFMFLCMVLYGTGFALLFPSINALIASHTTEKTRGKAFGLFYAFFSLGVVAGSTVLGLMGVTFNIGFLIAAALLLLTVCGMFIYFKKQSSQILESQE
ncbi:MFS transporter [Cytobacillus pseudoceanisediminis]|jgi:MFS family permease|uniref:Bicyclomycin resistance protein n=3 Tax=Cytobacillus TaxID=2675230 RepID=A0A169FUW6_9BACI|nr:MFS transporter [Cytobacillus oceanisediminis]AND41175.1 bicyclomycin resistance protein [Cytobacillus oceanisediminis 2691]MBU8731500.1 MFS transporter [Cytobacillus oceanisediminis]OHX48249.1 bicyclomycin resistance protein [Cytobacillus oceanisediminis]